MNAAEPRNICFYSNKCNWSKAFLTELSATPWKKEFRYICVDPSPARPQLPGWLKKVPTIVISGEAEPRTDAEVMNWLMERKMREGVGRQSGGPSAQAGPAEPSAFSLFEQTSFAKGFSYSGLDVDTSSQGQGGYSMPGAFEFLNGSASSAGDPLMSQGGNQGTAAANSSQKRSKKEELFDKQMEQYQRERNMGLPPGPSRI